MSKYQYTRTFKQYTLLCSDPDGIIYSLLDEIRKRTSIGHSFHVVIDKDDKDEITAFIDGDGSDKIHSIEIQEVEKIYTIDLAKLKKDANNLASCEKEQ